MQNKKAISTALEDYLKAIYLLQGIDHLVRLSDIAAKMSVSKPSVNRAVANLSEQGLVEHEKFGPIRLTARGMATAQKLVARHETIKCFLMRVLNISDALAGSEACCLEHTICDVTLAKMASCYVVAEL